MSIHVFYFSWQAARHCHFLYIIIAIDKSHKIIYPLRSEEHTSELQSRFDIVCRLLLEKKNEIRVRRGWSVSNTTVARASVPWTIGTIEGSNWDNCCSWCSEAADSSERHRQSSGGEAVE